MRVSYIVPILLSVVILSACANNSDGQVEENNSTAFVSSAPEIGTKKHHLVIQ